MTMVRISALAAALLAVTSLTPASAAVFNRVATFHVADNLPADADPANETVAEIISATEDGMTLVYTDSPGERVGIIDLTDPASPQPGGVVALDGEPTSVVIVKGMALVGVVTSEDFDNPSGHLAIVDIAAKSVTATCDLGGQPDSLAKSPDGRTLAVVIENERDEDENDGAIPQLPSGNLTVFAIGDDGGVDCGTMKVVELAGLADVAPTDAEAEYVDVNSRNQAVVTLQENNHLAIVDLAAGTVSADFSAGSVDLDGIDVEDDGIIRLTGAQVGVPREPDAVSWIDDERFVTANEGDWQGGSRGFTIFNKDGSVDFDSGTYFEYLTVRLGHYPDHRSDSKGAEPEGVEVGAYGEDTLIFVGAERASLVGVYRDEGAGNPPTFLQALPGGIGPEGLLAVPARSLFVTASEVDLRPDGGIGSVVTVYKMTDGEPFYPNIVSADDADGRPIGWAAISGTVADPAEAGRVYAVTDSALSEALILTLDTTQTPAVITAATVVSKDGAPAELLDLEGIALADGGGFWLASEGNPERENNPTQSMLVKTDANGAIVEEIAIPEALAENAVRFGFEGVAAVGSGADATVWIAVQREWKDDPKGQVKLLAYKPADQSWGAVRYPLDSADKGWIGLSELTAAGDGLLVIERDNQIGKGAKIKKVTYVPLAGVTPAPIPGSQSGDPDDIPVVEKTNIRDLLPDLASANGYVLDKVESLFIADGEAVIITDNDGVDDHSGETLLIRLGPLDLPM